MKIKKILTYITLFLTSVFICASLNTTCQAAENKGFVTEEDGIHYYYSDGTQATGKCRIKGKIYFFTSDGIMRTKWYTTSNGNTYYLTIKGACTGYKTIGKHSYYFKKNGKLTKGKVKVGKKLYYSDSKGRIYRTVDGNKKMIAITFDDGPSAYTYMVLDTLEEYNQVATFFVVGNRVSTYKNVLKRAYNMGCEIGSHTYTHPNLTKISKSKIKSELKKTAKAIKAVTGANPTVFRAPGGNVNDTVKSLVDLPIISWSVDTRDWETRSTKTTIKRIMAGAYDGAIILVHDLHESTCKAAVKFIPKLVKQGYQLVTVSELAELRGVDLNAGSVYNSFKK